MPLEPIAVLDGGDPTATTTYAAAPEDDEVLRELRQYQTHEVERTHEFDEYRDFLKNALRPLGLYSDEFLPDAASTCYRVTFDHELVAIFRLTPAAPDSALHHIIPGAAGKSIIEVNNIAVDKAFRGDLLLGIILRNCAVLSHTMGFDFVAGVIRQEILSWFTDFGTIPVRHEPLHLLGDETVNDFVTYFRTDSRECVDYAITRGYHYFHRKVTMRNIKADMKRARRRAADGELALHG
ncbi:hypothetical protein E1264_26460 [Actinomadura sp. KC216]|uniref:hypothetical protein n=1 Tax=Actinomadura sp. KC216 TaxID=2530370 RepID=UPI001050922D|nr:hypothetical protein [Actinomadura sp. KC216]TDB83931.1 hypothetical protein E1264_26460 [Actinomadura sp. KC216]